MKRFCWLFSLIATAVLLALLAVQPSDAAVGDSVVDTVHNLSATGPGTIRATNEQEVCVFCHSPHSKSSTLPLWNRGLPQTTYKPYSSNSLKAAPGQPTGSSKLCLSCHDGTVALGAVLSRGQQIQMSAGITTLPPGRTNLGTDLSDDHPISFKYDATLVTKNPKLRDPTLLPTTVKLDRNKELQCTSCHDPHANTNGNFLVMTNTNSELCNSCHVMGSTQPVAHQTCASCHKTHTAPSGPYLLAQAKVSSTCLTCHSGTVGTNQGPNIAANLNKAYNHDTNSPVNLVNHIPSNSDCKDCHEPHTMTAGGVTAPSLAPSLGKVSGITVGGAVANPANYEYEVCFKCHADQQAVQPRITRQIVQANTRLEFAPTAISFHPVAAKGMNSDVPSLKPPYTVNSIIYCTDCHGSDSSKKAGGTGPNGPHGSTNQGLLLLNYSTTDRVSEGPTVYALCYNCHDRTSLMKSSSVPFPYHAKHVQSVRTSCSTCHDSHGIASTQGNATRNWALINFDVSIVKANSAGKLYYEKTGTRHGRCFLTCHGANHNPLTY